jgi:signal transduction histidine kinase
VTPAPDPSQHRDPLETSSAALALLELSRSVCADWSDSIRRIVQFDADLLQVERVSFWRLSTHPSSIYCDVGYVATGRTFELGATVFEPDAPEYFAALRENPILNMPDVSMDPRCRGLRSYCMARGISSMLDVPVYQFGRLAGVLCHEHVGPIRRWTPREEQFAAGVAQVIASALAERRWSDAQAAASRGSFLDIVSHVLLESLDPAEIANRAADVVIPRLGCVSMIWMSSRAGILELVAASYVDPNRRAEVVGAARAAAEQGPPPGARLAFEQKQSLLLPAIVPANVPERYRPFLVDLGLTTSIAVPLTVAESTLGAMSLFDRDRRFGTCDLELAREVADRVALALENARLYATAREAIRARDEFLELAAHELRTPLTPLRLLVEASLRRAQQIGDAAEAKRWEVSVRQVNRLELLARRLLEALQARAGKLVLAPQTCDMAQIVARGVARETERARHAGSTIALRGPSTVVGIWDPAWLERVTLELIDNAVKFGAGKPIEIDVDCDEAHATLAIRDHGVGIAPDRISGIFSPFRRTMPKEHYSGLGLGLYIAKSMLAAHGGSLAVKSTVGEGTTIVVRLPLRPAAT